MISKVAKKLDGVMGRYTPDPFVIAATLTLVVLLLGKATSPLSLSQLTLSWGEGFWKLIPFTMQMIMILIGGFIVAASEPFQKFLSHFVGFARTPTQAIVLTTLGSCFAAWLNWGLGLVVGGFLAQEMARNIKGSNFKILVASAYSGFIVWHGGLSGSIPLVMNTPGSFASKWIDGQLVSVSETLYSPFNLVALLSMLITLPVLNVLMAKGASRSSFPISSNKKAPSKKTKLTPAQRLERSWILTGLITAMGFWFVGVQLWEGSFRMSLNNINFVLLFLGLALHGNFSNFIGALEKGVSQVGPLVIQYPFYAGIMALMASSGLALQVSEYFMTIANGHTLPWFSFLSAGLVNLFIPSGGGQWAIQGPIILPAVQSLGADLPKTIMAVAWGDAWTNMIQPFFAVPLLAIAGLTVKDIMGYCLVTLMVTGAVLSAVILIF